MMRNPGTEEEQAVWLHGFFHGVSVGIGVFTIGALLVLWSML